VRSLLRRWPFASAGTALAGGLLLWLQFSSVSWDAQRPATCMPSDCFCEAVRPGPMRQYADTWSNLAYVFVALLILAAETDPGSDNPLRADRAHIMVYGGITLALGLTSGWFHASLTFAGEWFDATSMFLLVCFVIAHNLRRGGAVGRAGFLAVFGALAVFSGLFLAYAKILRKETFAALILALVLTEVWARRRSAPLDSRWFGRALGVFLVSFGVWLLDQHHLVCSPYSLAQGHAVWHLLDAAVIGMLFVYYRSSPARNIL
jgi:hypothetical protein